MQIFYKERGAVNREFREIREFREFKESAIIMYSLSSLHSLNSLNTLVNHLPTSTTHFLLEGVRCGLSEKKIPEG